MFQLLKSYVQGVPMSRYILALDQGTTSSRAFLFDRSGNIIQMAQ